MILKEIIRGDHKMVIKRGIISSKGEQLYDIEYYEYFPSLREWRFLSEDKNYTIGALNLMGISV